jgi:hypothetical protein
MAIDISGVWPDQVTLSTAPISPSPIAPSVGFDFHNDADKAQSMAQGQGRSKGNRLVQGGSGPRKR